MDNVISSFYQDGIHSPLSNFYKGKFIPAVPFGVPGEELWWDTAEHYYQAAKFRSPEDIAHVFMAATPGLAKRRGRERLVSFRSDWEAVKYSAMRQILALKFAPGRFEADYLIGTKDALLIEGNNWGDRIWGCERVHGEWVGGTFALCACVPSLGRGLLHFPGDPVDGLRLFPLCGFIPHSWKKGMGRGYL